ncbi:acetolactate synthase [Cordyceps militaris]|uniref:Acetolactate synthase n=1 Tax=Cordyceps militaris TaxID=73501 RepID=A0A2H4SPB6_CORMI|nr:acetolactate synthase [Cordyceps militaris]
MYTASSAFFDAIWEAGVTHCFVNLGSDHPSFIDAMVKGQRENKDTFPRIITCPNEMVAMSMADGYARLTGKPQCVIIHVDVGTQALGAAVHNASSGRAPVLLFAGLSPFTLDGEHRGSRTEYIHWLQDVPDQRAIVAQYCRYAGEIKTGANVKQLVNRALQFAVSDPQGPTYLCGAREIMEADVAPYALRQADWSPIALGGLPRGAAATIAAALAAAARPLVITGYGGRKHAFAPALVRLADALPALQVLDTGGSDMCFPADHAAWTGMRFGVEPCIEAADAILVIDCDVPWIPTRCKPRADAVVYHIDVDPLKQVMPVAYIPARARFRADAVQALEQILESPALRQPPPATGHDAAERVQQEYRARIERIEQAAQPQADGKFGAGHLCSQLRALCPDDTIWAVEAVTNTPFVHDNIRPTRPGSWINCGGGGLGWSGGGALGIKLATDAESGGRGKFVVQIVGDGTYMFSVPSSVYWISMRYKIPILTIVLNNNGWNAPRQSYNLVHPDGLAQTASNDEINIAFNPTPDYAGIAKAAGCGDIFAGRVSEAKELPGVLQEAIDHVKAGKSAVLDCAVVFGC